MTKDTESIRGVMLALGTNLWNDFEATPERKRQFPKEVDFYSETMRFDDAVWIEATQRMHDRDLNLVLIDLAEGLVYPSHPELAVKGSWRAERMRTELARLRKLGLEPVPKLNFSTAHDVWLKEYARMVSTPEYYRVCTDIIRDVIDIFDKPRFLHLGYDEETDWHQSKYDYAVIRQGDLWWHDFLLFANAVERQGVRPWIWSDHCWRHREDFLRRMPKSVLQSNWYYSYQFDVTKLKTPLVKAYVSTYATLEKAGFDQVPCGSNIENPDNFRWTMEFCRMVISPERLKGFMMAPWTYTDLAHREQTLKAIDLAAEAFAANQAG